MGAYCCCELDVSMASMAELKRRMEGTTRRIREKPDIYVTIDELKLAGNGSFTFSPQKFTFRGLEVRCTVQVRGTPGQMAALAAGKAKDQACATLRISDQRRQSLRNMRGQAGHAVSAAAHAVGRMASPMTSAVSSKFGSSNSLKGPSMEVERSVHVDCTIDMDKEFGSEDVRVKVKKIKSDMRVLEAILTSEKAKSVIETAVSERASEAATRMAKTKSEQVYEQISAVAMPSWCPMTAVPAAS